MVALSTVDNLWMDHLTVMEDLRTGIGLRGYGQRDPLIEYKNDDKSLLDLVGLEMELKKKLRKKVDLLTYDSIHPLLRESILEDQKIIL